MDLGKLMSMWEESKREVEESANENNDAEYSNSHWLDEKAENVNQELKHLKHRIKQYKYREEDLEDELGELSNKNEQLENQIEKIGKQLSDALELLKNKDNIENEFENKTNASDILIQKLRKNNEELSKQVDSLLEREVMCNNAENVSDANHSDARKVPSNEDIEELMREIEHLRDGNKEKKDLIIKLSEENEIATEKLKLKEIDNENRTAVNFQNSAKSLHEELCLSADGDIFDQFTCNLCGKSFGNISDLKKHERIDHEKKHFEKTLAMVEKANLKMQVHINKSILKLKEKEDGERYMCYCRSRCRIFHKKHNWSKPKSIELIARLDNVGMTAQIATIANANLLSCNKCEMTFKKMSKLKEHTEVHQKQLIVNNTQGNETRVILDADIITKNDDEISHQVRINNESENSGAKPKVYNCDVCENSFNRLCELKEHVNQMHISRRETAKGLENFIENKEVETPEYDSKDTDAKENLPSTKSKSFDQTKKYIGDILNLCSVCFLSFKTEEELSQHISKHRASVNLPSILKKV